MHGKQYAGCQSEENQGRTEVIQRRKKAVFVTEDCQEFGTYTEAAMHQMNVAQSALKEFLIQADMQPANAGIIAGNIVASKLLQEELIKTVEKLDLRLQDK